MLVRDNPADAATQHLPMLSPGQISDWQRDGFLALPGFKSAAELDAAKARAQQIVEAFDPATGASRFSTRDRSLVADERLLASADQVHCFFEEEALDDQGRLRVPKAQSINKIGHALHDRDPVFERFSHGPALAELAADLGLAQPQVWQSQLIFKQPHIGGEVGWHQDASFFDTDPITVTTLWFALEDATLDNGCLWVQPGGHHTPLRERYLCEDRQLRMETAQRHALARRQPGARAAGGGGHAGRLPWPAAALQRAESVGAFAAGLHAARHRRQRRLLAAELAAAQRRLSGARIALKPAARPRARRATDHGCIATQATSPRS